MTTTEKAKNEFQSFIMFTFRHNNDPTNANQVLENLDRIYQYGQLLVGQ